MKRTELVMDKAVSVEVIDGFMEVSMPKNETLAIESLKAHGFKSAFLYNGNLMLVKEI